MLSLSALARDEMAGEDPLVLDGQDPAWVQAEAFRKAGDFERAGPYFYEQWTQGQQGAAGWRYAFCLRKAGHAEAGLRVAFKVASLYPEDRAAISEKVWALYEARLKPALAAEKHHQVLQVAEQMVQAGADSFALKVAVFAGMRAAKESRQWEKVLEWCSQIDPLSLSTAPKKMGERKSLSDRERYFYARLKAAVELKRWEEALSVAEQALGDFDRNQDFHRWKATSLAALGDLEPALQVLDEVRKTGRARWYLLVDQARVLLQLQRLDEAWKVALEATRAPVEDSHKLGLYELMARIALHQGRQDCAVDHVGWCLALRSHERWSKGAGLEELELLLCHAVDDWLPDDPQHWRDRAVLHWGSRPAPVVLKDSQWRQGVVEQFRVNRNYCFVLCDGERYYTLMKDVPGSCRHDGATVKFRLSPHFDPKKQQDSLRAVQLTPL